MNEQIPSNKILEWFITAGADETIGDEPVDRFAPPPAAQPSPAAFSPAPAFTPQPPAVPVYSNPQAEKAETLEELKNLMAEFNDCPLKATATNLVFGMGNPHARLMIIGEAPGKDEDLQGLPFVGVSGQLLDKMLLSVGLTRKDVYISNILPWRPPANRKPSESETAMFLPFVRRHIALVKPQILLLLGGTSLSTLMQTNAGIIKSRGRWMTYTDKELSIDTLASFHPAYLLRDPAQKKYSWRDFLAVKARLTALSESQH